MEPTLADIESDLKEKQDLEKKDNKKTTENAEKTGKNKYRRDKPWDTDDVDHWKLDKFEEGDMKGGSLLEESSFAVLFPSYREQYLKTIWPDVKHTLESEHGIRAELDLVEGSMTVRTTKKTWDPFIIMKSRDLIKLLARSVPFTQAKKILQDDTNCDIVKISSYVRNKEKFVKRRQRLVGPNGSTLKAIELLTECYVLVQGQTCCIMGGWKGIKQVRRIVEDCFKNIHPVYAVKELMIMRELEKDESLKNEDWSKFLPKFRKRNIQSKKLKKKQKEMVAKTLNKKKKRKEDGTGNSIFPPEQTPRKEDLLMETGEYFLSDQQKEVKKREEIKTRQEEKTKERKRKRIEENFIAKEENKESHAAKRLRKNESEAKESSSTNDLVEKLKKKDIGKGSKDTSKKSSSSSSSNALL